MDVAHIATSSIPHADTSRRPSTHTRARVRDFLVTTALAMLMLDVVVTLVGQPIAYWMGRYELAEEYNPLGHAALATHPLVFLAMMTAWAAAVVVVGRHLPFRFAIPVAALVTGGHAFGAASWVLNRESFGGVSTGIVLLLVTALWTGLFVRRPPGAAPHRPSLVTRAAVAAGATVLVVLSLPPAYPVANDDATWTALVELERGRPDLGEMLATAAYLRSLRTPVGSPERWVAESGLAVFYERAGRRRDATAFARAAVATAEAGTLTPAVAKATRRMLAASLATPTTPLP